MSLIEQKTKCSENAINCGEKNKRYICMDIGFHMQSNFWKLTYTIICINQGLNKKQMAHSNLANLKKAYLQRN